MILLVFNVEDVTISEKQVFKYVLSVSVGDKIELPFTIPINNTEKKIEIVNIKLIKIVFFLNNFIMTSFL